MSKKSDRGKRNWHVFYTHNFFTYHNSVSIICFSQIFVSSALHLAVTAALEEEADNVFKFLLEQPNLNVNLKNKYNESAMDMAKENTEILPLLENHASFKKKEKAPRDKKGGLNYKKWFRAAEDADKDMIESFLAYWSFKLNPIQNRFQPYEKIENHHTKTRLIVLFLHVSTWLTCPMWFDL